MLRVSDSVSGGELLASRRPFATATAAPRAKPELGVGVGRDTHETDALGGKCPISRRMYSYVRS
jgi:hypothetical protein